MEPDVCKEGMYREEVPYEIIVGEVSDVVGRDISEMNRCKPCPRGFYNNKTGRASRGDCIPCPVNYTTIAIASTWEGHCVEYDVCMDISCGDQPCYRGVCGREKPPDTTAPPIIIDPCVEVREREFRRKQTHWFGLSRDERYGYMALGWDENLWKDLATPPTMTMNFSDLTPIQKVSVTVNLSYTPDQWNLRRSCFPCTNRDRDCTDTDYCRAIGDDTDQGVGQCWPCVDSNRVPLCIRHQDPMGGDCPGKQPVDEDGNPSLWAKPECMPKIFEESSQFVCPQILCQDYDGICRPNPHRLLMHVDSRLLGGYAKTLHAAELMFCGHRQTRRECSLSTGHCLWSERRGLCIANSALTLIKSYRKTFTKYKLETPKKHMQQNPRLDDANQAQHKFAVTMAYEVFLIMLPFCKQFAGSREECMDVHGCKWMGYDQHETLATKKDGKESLRPIHLPKCRPRIPEVFDFQIEDLFDICRGQKDVECEPSEEMMQNFDDITQGRRYFCSFVNQPGTANMFCTVDESILFDVTRLEEMYKVEREIEKAEQYCYYHGNVLGNCQSSNFDGCVTRLENSWSPFPQPHLCMGGDGLKNRIRSADAMTYDQKGGDAGYLPMLGYTNITYFKRHVPDQLVDEKGHLRLFQELDFHIPGGSGDKVKRNDWKWLKRQDSWDTMLSAQYGILDDTLPYFSPFEWDMQRACFPCREHQDCYQAVGFGNSAYCRKAIMPMTAQELKFSGIRDPKSGVLEPGFFEFREGLCAPCWSAGGVTPCVDFKDGIKGTCPPQCVKPGFKSFTEQNFCGKELCQVSIMTESFGQCEGNFLKVSPDHGAVGLGAANIWRLFDDPFSPSGVIFRSAQISAAFCGRYLNLVDCKADLHCVFHEELSLCTGNPMAGYLGNARPGFMVLEDLRVAQGYCDQFSHQNVFKEADSPAVTVAFPRLLTFREQFEIETTLRHERKAGCMKLKTPLGLPYCTWENERCIPCCPPAHSDPMKWHADPVNFQLDVLPFTQVDMQDLVIQMGRVETTASPDNTATTQLPTTADTVTRMTGFSYYYYYYSSALEPTNNTAEIATESNISANGTKDEKADEAGEEKGGDEKEEKGDESALPDVGAVLPGNGAVGKPVGDGADPSAPGPDKSAKNVTRANATVVIPGSNITLTGEMALLYNRTNGALVYRTRMEHIDGTNGMEIMGYQHGITRIWQAQDAFQFVAHPFKVNEDISLFDRDLGFGQWCGTGRWVGTCEGAATGHGWQMEETEGCTTLNGIYSSLEKCQAICATNLHCEFMGHRVMMEEESDGVWNGPFHYCEFWTAEARPGQLTCDKKAKDPYDCCSGKGGRYIVQENNILLKWKDSLALLPPYRSCMDAEVATEGKARCDLPGYEKWYYSTGNLYRKTSSVRSGKSHKEFKELYREALLIEALKPAYLEKMNMTYDHGNHSLILGRWDPALKIHDGLGVPSYEKKILANLQDVEESKLHYYYYGFYKDLAARNEKPVEEVLSDFASCFLSACNDDCHRGTNADLRGCTDIFVPGSPDPTKKADNPTTAQPPGAEQEAPSSAPEAAETRPRLVGLKHMMRSCWTRGGAMCSEECLAVHNETWTCLENQESCSRFMGYFTGQMRDDEEACFTDLRTTPTTAVPELPEIVTEIWKTPVFRQVLLTEGPISAAYLVERMCSTLSTKAECERESICGWQMIRRASSDMYACAVDDDKVFFNAASLAEVLTLSEDIQRVCYYHGFEGVCTKECPGSQHGSAQLPYIAGLLFFLVSL
jgi:hypothetical protein